MKYFTLILTFGFSLVGCQAPMSGDTQGDAEAGAATNQPTTETPFGVEQLLSHASSSQCARATVPGRGAFPDGWYNGMVLAFARSACRGIDGSGADLAYSNMVEPGSSNDALGRLTESNVTNQTYTKNYNRELAKYSASQHPSGRNQLYLPVYSGLDLDTESDRLEVLYSLLLTLGMRESSGGKHNGIDRSAAHYRNCMRNTPEQCEAGSLQASQNSSASRSMRGLYSSFSDQYWNALAADYEATCHWTDFNEGISRRTEDPEMESGTLRNTGNKYKDFRNLMIGCPAANVEYNAILLRKTYRHHGPVKRFEAPLYGECVDMFSELHDLIEKHPKAICDVALAPLR